jgi:hypothetical protein
MPVQQRVGAFVVSACLLGVCPISVANEPGPDRFITSLGVYSLYDGKLTIKVYKKAGKINTRMIRENDDREPSEPPIEDGKSWFVYPSSADQVWIFDGRNALFVYEPDEAPGNYVFIKADATHKILKRAPKEVLDRLPMSFKDKHSAP